MPRPSRSIDLLGVLTAPQDATIPALLPIWRDFSRANTLPFPEEDAVSPLPAGLLSVLTASMAVQRHMQLALCHAPHLLGPIHAAHALEEREHPVHPLRPVFVALEPGDTPGEWLVAAVQDGRVVGRVAWRFPTNS